MVIGTFSESADIGLLSGAYFLAVLIPSIAVTVRRFHDTNRSTWWVLMVIWLYLYNIALYLLLSHLKMPIVYEVYMVISLVFIVIYLVFTLQDSTKEENRYGPSPKTSEVS